MVYSQPLEDHTQCAGILNKAVLTIENTIYDTSFVRSAIAPESKLLKFVKLKPSLGLNNGLSRWWTDDNEN